MQGLMPFGSNSSNPRRLKVCSVHGGVGNILVAVGQVRRVGVNARLRTDSPLQTPSGFGGVSVADSAAGCAAAGGSISGGLPSRGTDYCGGYGRGDDGVE